MLKQLIIENWKSFRYAALPIDPLTVLIGTNSSGKSNVVEASNRSGGWNECRWIVQVVLRSKEHKGFVLLPKRWMVERTYEKVNGVLAIGQRLGVIARNIGDFYLPCFDPCDGEATGIKFDSSKLLKHPLRLALPS